MARWGQSSSAQQLRSRLASQRAAESLFWLDEVLRWHGYAAPMIKLIHVKPMQSRDGDQPLLLPTYLMGGTCSYVPQKEWGIFLMQRQWKWFCSKCLIKLTTLPVPVLKTSPVIDKKKKREETFCLDPVLSTYLFFIYSFLLPKVRSMPFCCRQQLPLSNWDLRHRKQGQDFSSDFW